MAKVSKDATKNAIKIRQVGRRKKRGDTKKQKSPWKGKKGD